MNVTYTVDIDLTPALDQYGYMDDEEASRIAHQSADYPDGATIRLYVGNASGGCLFKLPGLLARAGTVELAGTRPSGMRIIAAFLSSSDPYAVV